MDNKAIRWNFYDAFFKGSPKSPEEDLGLLCSEWLKVMKADWTWLWLADQNAYSTEFQLVAAASRAPDAILPDVLARETDTSVTKYCLKTGVPCLVKNVRKWHRNLDGVKYYVGLADLLEKSGCTTFVSIPIPVYRSKDSIAPLNDTVTAVVCAHYRRTNPPRHEKGTLKLLAGFSGQWIANSQDAHQRSVLIKLNEIAYRHVARQGQSAVARRQSYAQDVITLVGDELKVGAVTLFWEDTFREELHCLATTGLTIGDKNEEVKDLSRVKYAPLEGKTGHCWNTAIASTSTHHSPLEGSARFVERVTDEHGNLIHEPATIIYPIRRYASGQSETAGPGASGVIRCAAHKSLFFGSKKISFNAFETETLDFICRQIAPILANVTATIRRESATHGAAHDINAAIRLLGAHLLKLGELKHLNNVEACIAAARKTFIGVEMSSILLKSASSQLTLLEHPHSGIGESIRLLDLLERCVPALQYWAEAFHSSLRFTKHEFDANCFVPEGPLERALVNIVHNALRYGKEKGEIHMSVGSLGADVFIDIANFGPGISRENTARIFEPGFRGHSNREPGDGMGLPSASRLIRRIGGVLSLVRPKDPTVFRILLPYRSA
jgi:hypothetical protein